MQIIKLEPFLTHLECAFQFSFGNMCQGFFYPNLGWSVMSHGNYVSAVAYHTVEPLLKNDIKNACSTADRCPLLQYAPDVLPDIPQMMLLSIVDNKDCL